MAMAIPFMKPLSNFLFGEREEVDPETGEVTKKKSIFQAMKDGMINKFKVLYKKMPKWMKYIAEKVLPKDLVSQLESGDGETNLFEGVDVAADAGSEPEVEAELIPTEQEKKVRKTGRRARRRGGPVRKNEPYMVGEAGPELFVPTNNGSVVDNTSTENLKNILDKNTFIDVNNMNLKISQHQINELKKNNKLLQAILEKSNSGNTVINNKSSSIVNNQSRSGFRDMQFAV